MLHAYTIMSFASIHKILVDILLFWWDKLTEIYIIMLDSYGKLLKVRIPNWQRIFFPYVVIK